MSLLPFHEWVGAMGEQARLHADASATSVDAALGDMEWVISGFAKIHYPGTPDAYARVCSAARGPTTGKEPGVP